MSFFSFSLGQRSKSNNDKSQYLWSRLVSDDEVGWWWTTTEGLLWTKSFARLLFRPPNCRRKYESDNGCDFFYVHQSRLPIVREIVIQVFNRFPSHA